MMTDVVRAGLLPWVARLRDALTVSVKWPRGQPLEVSAIRPQRTISLHRCSGKAAEHVLAGITHWVLLLAVSMLCAPRNLPLGEIQASMMPLMHFVQRPSWPMGTSE